MTSITSQDRGNKPLLIDRPLSDHWADIYASKIVRQRLQNSGQNSPKTMQEPFICASGITPSGTIHIGNFREIISVELVVRALKDLGVTARFIYFWDDYDVFRKVPANMPRPEMLQEFLRQSITRVPDVQGNATSYARANELQLEQTLPKVGIYPEYIYQAERYQNSVYAEGMRQALAQAEVIREQLDRHRTEPLPPDWWPISFFCGGCGRDTTTCAGWNGKWQVSYVCTQCAHGEEVDLRHTALAKLPWRIDWPMRWAHEKVDFEPAGKDHHSEGGSFSTAKEICQAVYGYTAPITFQYDFVRIKGCGGKISSSAGEVLSLDDVLEIYSPEILRFLFASTRPNTEFAISFDLDVLKIYDDFVRCEQAFYQGLKDGKAAKKQAKLKRIYELSQVGLPPVQQPFALPLRHLCNLLQIYDGNVEAVRHFLWREGNPVPAHSSQRFATWAQCAWNWVQTYAPEEFRFCLRKPGQQPLIATVSAESKAPATAPEMQEFLPKLREFLRQQLSAAEFDRKQFSSGFYHLLQQTGLESQQLFPQIYQLLIGRNDGPRLISFLEAIYSAVGLETLLQLLQP